jgi:hypothetical protein
VSEPRPKPFDISRQAVWDAYRRVKANKVSGDVQVRFYERRGVRLPPATLLSGPHLISTADRISARLGYRRNDEMLDGCV